MSTITREPALTPYRNRSGTSGIAAYALLDDGLLVRFIDGATYRYGLQRAQGDTISDG